MGNVRIPRVAPQAMRTMERSRRPDTAAPETTSPPATQPLSRRMWQSWSEAPRLADILSAHDNSFGVMRLLLALAVLVSHAVFLATGATAAEPLVAWTGYSLGQFGVQGFFILSGLLVTHSLASRDDLMDYARARAMRIFPALVVCVLLTALALGPMVTRLSLGEYFTAPGLFAYLAKTLSLSTGSAPLPGVFEANPAASEVNQSLWTLKYEVACYLLLGGVVALTVWFRAAPRAVGMLWAVWVAIMLAVSPSLGGAGNFFATLSYFALFFGTGVSFYLVRNTLRLWWPIVAGLSVLFVAGLGSQMMEFTSALFLGYAVLWLATWSFGGLRAFCNDSDYSYGTYIYSYPVTQTLLLLFPGINIVSLVASALAVTLLLAFLSWETIERPALALVRQWRQPRVSADRVLRRRVAVETAVPAQALARVELSRIKTRQTRYPIAVGPQSAP